MSVASRRARLAAAVLALAAAAATGPAPAETSAHVYVFSRGSGYATGNSELMTPVIVVPEGGRLTFVNLHLWGHSITSDAWRARDVRLFRSDVIPFNSTTEVAGVGDLRQGSYGFFCANHMSMRGTLRIVPQGQGGTR